MAICQDKITCQGDADGVCVLLQTASIITVADPELSLLKQQIEDVDGRINTGDARMKVLSDMKPEPYYKRDDLTYLREEGKQLREGKRQLREKELLLLRKYLHEQGKQSREKKRQLREKELLLLRKSYNCQQ